MTKMIQRLLSKAAQAGIELWVDSGELRFRAQQPMDEALKNELAEHKQAIIKMLEVCELGSVPVGHGPLFEPSFAQERMWFIQKVSGASAHYNIALHYRINGALDVALLKEALESLVERHAILRTSFVEVEGHVKQRVARELPLESYFSVEMAPLSQPIFDLSNLPLFKIVLCSTENNSHDLMFYCHHIIADEASLQIMFNELQVIYDALKNKAKPELVGQSISYVDFSLWQKAQFKIGAMHKQMAFWQAHIKASDDILDFPYDFKRPAKPSYQGAKLARELKLSHAQMERLKAKVPGATSFTVMLSAYIAFLHRYTSQSVICVGIPYANRDNQQLTPLMGMFVNSLPIQVSIDENEHFLSLLKKVSDLAVQAYENANVPFEKIVDALKMKRSAAVNPLFQTMFFSTGGASGWSLEGCDVERAPHQTSYAKFDFSFSYSQSASGIQLEIEYSTDLLKAATASRMLSHFEQLLLSGINEESAKISQLPMISESEFNWHVYTLNDNVCDYDQNVRVIELFERQVQANPEHIAVEFKTDHITFAELNAKANQLARKLKILGVGPEQTAMVFMERSIDVAIAILGVMKAGGAFIPLDIEYPAARIEHILNDSGATVILTQKQYQDRLSFSGVTQLTIERDHFEAFSDFEKTDLAHETTMSNLAYIIYTSGSTGKPKGVMIEQSGFAHYMMWAVEHYDCAKGCGCPVHSSLGFDLTITTIFAPLISGKTIFMTPEELGVEGLLQALQKRQDYSMIKITPAHLKLFQALLEPQVLKNLYATVIIGGEALYADDLAFWHEHSPNMRFINEYGATETTVANTIFEVGADFPKSTSIPVGMAIPNSSMFVLDKHLKPQPVGVVGEIYLGGNQIARGYCNRDDLNPLRYLACPFEGLVGDRIYKTGDLGVLLEDGNVVFVGRVDNQVKVNGYRIELGEIETCLEEREEVDQAICQVIETEQHGKSIVAYIVLEKGSAVEEKILKQYLHTKLPEYMIPKFTVFLDELPLTINGKVDTRALPEPEQLHESYASEFKAPTNEIEAILAQVWSELFGLENVSTDANFFQLGGDSISSLQMIFEVKKQGFQIKPRDIFHCQTIAELAHVTARQQTEIETNLYEGEFALMPIQKWFFELDLMDQNHWNQSFVFDINLPVDVPVIEEALNQILLHHDALRLAFNLEVSPAVQFYQANKAIDLKVHDVSGLDQDQRQALKNQAQASLSLEEGRLLAAVLLQDEGKSKLLLVVHHLLVDGVSWRIIHDDLNSLLSGKTLEPKTSAFSTWAMRLTDYSDTILPEESAYWLNLNKASSALNLPWQSATNLEKEAHNKKVSLECEIPACLDVQTFLLCALAKTLDSKVVIDVEGHGRESLFDDVDLSRTVGWFTSMYPVQLNVVDEDVKGLTSLVNSLKGLKNHGLHYGLVQPFGGRELCFNFLGDFSQSSAADRALTLSFDSAGLQMGPENKRPYQMNINSYIQNGLLHINVIANLNEEALQAFVEQYFNQIKNLLSSLGEFEQLDTAVKLAKSVMPDDIPALMSHFGECLEDAYPLTKLQEGMLYHSLYSPESREYICQLCWDIDEPIEEGLLESAWLTIIQRYEILRSVFSWEEAGDIYQIILSKADGAFKSLSIERGGIEAFLKADHQRGFDLNKAPPQRLSYVRSGQKSYLVLTFHHILLDGWSVSKIISELKHLAKGEQVTYRPFKFEQYVDYCRQAQSSSALNYWRGYLEQHRAAATAFGGAQESYHASYCEHKQHFNAVQTARLVEKAKSLGVTVNALTLASVGYAINSMMAQSQTYIGVTVSGRSAPIMHIEDGVGNFLNTIVMAIDSDGKDVDHLARNVQDDLAMHQGYEHCSLSTVQHEYEKMTGAKQLFDILYVFENYPVAAQSGQALSLSDLKVQEFANYPLTVVASLRDEQLSIALTFDENRIEKTLVEQLEQLLMRRFGQSEAHRETAESLIELCCEVLKIDSVDLNESFRSIGGSSLSAIRLLSKIRQAFGVVISLKAFAQLPTLSELVDYIVAATNDQKSEDREEMVL